MEDNEQPRDQVEQKEIRGMSNKSDISSDSSLSRKHETKECTPISPLRMPDLPHPTPPPMANIMITSRIGYRRILGGRTSECGSPILGCRSHSMDFGNRVPSMYGVETRREHFRSGTRKSHSTDEDKYHFNAVGCLVNESKKSRSIDNGRHHFNTLGGRKNEFIADANFKSDNKTKYTDFNVEEDYMRRCQTLNAKRPVFRDTRASTVEFMSPILSRAYLYHRDGRGDYGGTRAGKEFSQHQASLTDQLGLSPLPRHRNIEDLTERLEDFTDYPIYPLGNRKSPDFSNKRDQLAKITPEHRSKYFSRDSVLSNELEEVRTLNNELQKKYIGDTTEENINRLVRSRSTSETSPEYYNVFMNEHYISDIDENEEIKEFVCGYKPIERRYSDQSDGKIQKSLSEKNISDYHKKIQSLPLPATVKPPCIKQCSKKINRISPPNTSAFVVKQSVRKMTDTRTSAGARLSSTSSDNLDLISSKNNEITRSSDPLSIPDAYQHSSGRLSQINSALSNSSATLPISSAHSRPSSCVSSIKSSDYYSFVPLATSSVKKVEFSGDSTGKVIKSPQRTIVKLAKIRLFLTTTPDEEPKRQTFSRYFSTLNF